MQRERGTATGTTRRIRVIALLRRATALTRRSVAIPTRQRSEPSRTGCGPWLSQFTSPPVAEQARKLASSAPLTGSFLRSLVALTRRCVAIPTQLQPILDESAAQLASSLVRTPSHQWQPNHHKTRCSRTGSVAAPQLRWWGRRAILAATEQTTPLQQAQARPGGFRHGPARKDARGQRRSPPGWIISINTTTFKSGGYTPAPSSIPSTSRPRQFTAQPAQKKKTRVPRAFHPRAESPQASIQAKGSAAPKDAPR